MGECDGSGWITWCGDDGYLTRPCRCTQARARQAQADRLLSSAGIPARYADRGIDGLDGRYPEGKRILAAYVAGWPTERGVAIIGDMGVGKTAHAYAMVHDLCVKGAQALAVNAPDLLDDLGRPDHRGDERMDLLAGAELVMLDDFGAHRATEWAAGRLYSLINRRYSDKRPTCITSMVPLSSLARSVSDPRLGKVWAAAVDRLVETCDVVLLRGKSRRTEAAGMSEPPAPRGGVA